MFFLKVKGSLGIQLWFDIAMLCWLAEGIFCFGEGEKAPGCRSTCHHEFGAEPERGGLCQGCHALLDQTRGLLFRHVGEVALGY